MEFTACPECGVVAEVVDRVVLSSTHGPIEFVRLHCVKRHRFFMPVRSMRPGRRA